VESVKIRMSSLYGKFGKIGRMFYEDTDSLLIKEPNVEYWLKALENHNLDDYSKELINRMVRKELRKLLKPVTKGGMFDE
jgi:hypothetical protein